MVSQRRQTDPEPDPEPYLDPESDPYPEVPPSLQLAADASFCSSQLRASSSWISIQLVPIGIRALPFSPFSHILDSG